jgi:hypothetical protein
MTADDDTTLARAKRFNDRELVTDSTVAALARALDPPYARGFERERIALLYQRANGLDPDGMIGEMTRAHVAQSAPAVPGIVVELVEPLSYEALEEYEDPYALRDHLSQGLPPITDRREHARPSYVDAAKQRVYYTPRPRLLRIVRGWTLHQTAAVLGDLREDRWDTVGAHRGVTAAGQRYLLHDLGRVVYHGNGWNALTGGIEIDGLFAGVEGDRSTVWKNGPESHLTDLQTQAVMWTIVDGYIEVAEGGGGMTALVAHRQSSATRRNDPGGEIWRRIALVMQRLLELRDGGQVDHRFKIGGGSPIPEAWNPARKGVPY